MSKRSCGTCTKCCEGYLSGEALGHTFYQGKPCHFLAIGQGCTVYAKRPKDPCTTYKCSWLSNPDIPEWMKPNLVDVIIDESFINDIPYLRVKEAGKVLPSTVLTWLFQYAMKNKRNLYWQVEGGENWFGSQEFLNAMANPIRTGSSPSKDSFAHQEPKDDHHLALEE